MYKNHTILILESIENLHLFLSSERTQYCNHYVFIYLLQHVSAVCIGHHQQLTCTEVQTSPSLLRRQKYINLLLFPIKE